MVTRTALLLAAVSFASPASAQVSYLGKSCKGGSGEKPDLTIAGLPVDTEDIEIVVTGPADALGLALGGADRLFPPIALDDVGVPGCDLHVEPLAIVPFVLDGSGSATMPLTTWTQDLTVYVQAFVHDEGPETLGSMTRTAEITSLGFGGDIVVTEIMKNPDFVGDAQGEWIELFNRSDADVDIEGWTLRDDGADSVVLDNGGAGIVVPAQGYATLGNGADPVTNGNHVHDFVFTGFMLENGADEVVLEDDAGQIVDRVPYGEGSGWPDEIGASLALDADYVHTYYSGLAEHWVAATCDTGGVPFNVDKATPGYANDECDVAAPAPPTGELIFSEVMQNPKAVFDDFGEWFELHNTTGQTFDLDGWTLVAGGIEVLSGSVVVPPGGYVVFAANPDPALNGGLPAAPDYVWAEGLFLGNGTETLQLYDTSFALICEVTYDNGGEFPDPSGRSMVLDPTMLTIDESLEGANWCEATSAYGDGDKGTPGAPNDSCP